ncbi:MAG TPA: MDR family MFS transporter [Longimicrobiales bacterium]
MTDAAPSRGVSALSISPRDRTFTLVGVLTALLLAGIDHTIVSTAGPAIQADLHIPASFYAWITTSYLVASTVVMPIYGKLSDIYGRKPILLIGVVLFLAGSAIGGLSPNTATLIAGRTVQGLGAASLFTSALAVIADLFPPQQRARYMGLLSATMGISSVIGPLVGGVVTDTLGWHWAFFINLPLGAVALWLITTRMPNFSVQRGARVDIAGAVTLAIGVVPLLIALSLLGGSEGAMGGATSPRTLGMLVGVGIAGLIAFVMVERRAPDPIVDARLFRGRTVALATAAMFVFGFAFLFTVIFLPLFLVNVIGISATSAGFALTPLMLGMVSTSIGSGQLVSRYGHPRRFIIGGLALLLGAFALVALTLHSDTSRAQITLMMVLIGLGFGPSLPLFTLIVQNAVPQKDIGAITATSSFARSMGQVIGVTVFGALFASALMAAAGPRANPELIAHMPEALTASIRLLYLAALVPVAIAIGLTWLIPDEPLRPAGRRGAAPASPAAPAGRPAADLHADEHLHPDDPSGVS